MDMQIDITYARSLKEMASLLRYLISIYGTELYKDKQRLYNLIADLYTGEERLKRLFRRAILEDNLSQRVYELIHKKIGERKALVDKIACLFAENNFISYEVGEKVVLDFVKGLNLLLENPLRLREDGKWEDEQGNVYSEDRLTFEKANRGVSEIIVKEGTEEIGKEACRDCTSLISIALPSSLTKIGYSAFEGCSSLSSIIIPEHVTKISYSAFENCI